MRFKEICEGSQTLIKPYFAIITYTDMFAFAHKTKILQNAPMTTPEADSGGRGDLHFSPFSEDTLINHASHLRTHPRAKLSMVSAWYHNAIMKEN